MFTFEKVHIVWWIDLLLILHHSPCCKLLILGIRFYFILKNIKINYNDKELYLHVFRATVGGFFPGTPFSPPLSLKRAHGLINKVCSFILTHTHTKYTLNILLYCLQLKSVIVCVRSRTREKKRVGGRVWGISHARAAARGWRQRAATPTLCPDVTSLLSFTWRGKLAEAPHERTTQW